MILTIEELKGLAPSCAAESDTALTLWLEGVEAAIKGETNNDFARYRGESGEIEWPADIRLGVVNLRKWEDGSRARLSDGVASETISRHSRSYEAAQSTETVGGFPKHLMGFLDPYRRARFA